MNLPLASGGGDLFGLLVFVVIAIISWLTNRAKNAGDDSRRPSEAPPQGKPIADDTLEEWLKGLVDEQKPSAPPHPPPVQHSPPPSRMPPPLPSPRAAPPGHEQRRAPPPLRAESVRRPPPPLRPAPVRSPRPSAPPKRTPVVEEPVIRTYLAPSGPDIQSEIHEFTAKVADEVHTTREELMGSPAAAAAPRADPTSIATILRSRGGLKQGVVLMEVLGQPRAFAPPSY